MNTEGDIILAKNDENRLYKYTLSGGEFSESWCRELHEVRQYCNKAVTSAGQALVQDINSSSTVMLSLDEQHKETRWQSEGELLGCLSPDRRVYALKKEEGNWEVVIVEQEGERRLRSSPAHRWGMWLSVCEAGGKVAVVDRDSKTLTIFSGIAEECHHLLYKPRMWNAVCCSVSHVFVAEYGSPAYIHIQTWDGVYRQRLSHQALGLLEDEYIHGIQYNRREGILQLAVGSLTVVSSLHALQVHHKYPPNEKLAKLKQQIEAAWHQQQFDGSSWKTMKGLTENKLKMKKRRPTELEQQVADERRMEKDFDYEEDVDYFISSEEDDEGDGDYDEECYDR